MIGLLAIASLAMSAPLRAASGAPALGARVGASALRPISLSHAASRSAVHMLSDKRQSPYDGWPNFLRPDTNGGAIGLTVLGIVVPAALYNALVASGMDSIRVGQIFIVGYVGIGTIAWTLSYVLRVATKDTTYAQQLKDYETAVLQKRLEELDESEIEALMAEVDKEELS
jgi:hypothetical protein